MNNNKVEILLYTSYLHIIGGIETFIYNWIELMGSSHDIGVACPNLPPEVEAKIRLKAKVFKTYEPIKCDTLIMIRMMDPIPIYVTYEKSIRMCHACKSNPSWMIRQDCNKVVHVSKASKSSFNSKGEVIYNPLFKNDNNALLLVSATRIPALDKGKNADRMIKLARMLNDAAIPFIWFNFSDMPLTGAPKGFVNVGHFEDIQPYISRADYLVMLSDQEGFGYSVVEALINHTSVVCTGFETTKELGVIDGKNGYIVPFDLNFDVRKLLKVPKFEYRYDNEKIRKKWEKLLAEKSEKPNITMVPVRVVVPYTDIELQRELKSGEELRMSQDRAEYIQSLGYLRILGG